MMIKKIKGKTLAFRLRILAITLVVLIAALTVTAFAATATANSYVVDIYENSTVTRVETSKTDASAILAGAKIVIGENDKVDVSSFKAGQDSSIVVYRYSAVTLTTTDGNTITTSFAGTVGDLLKDNSVTLLADDAVNYPLYTALSDGMNVKVEKAYLVKVTADGSTSDVRVGFVKVADALAAAGVSVDEDDIVTPDATADVTDGMEITVSRVSVVSRTETEKIAYQTVSKKSSAFLAGTKQVTQTGVEGSKKVTYSDRYVDGVLVESAAVSEKVTKNAVDKIITTGTGAKAITTSTVGGGCISELSIPSSLQIENGAPTSYKSVVTGKAAAYTADSTAKTASGRTVKPGYVAVDPNQFPYGTELWIVATDGTVYGYAIAADTGGFVNKGKFTVDLFMNSYNQCINWGSKDVIIYVL